HYVQYGGNPTNQLMTKCTQCTRCTWTFHIIYALRQLYGIMSNMAGIQPVSL
ncbi:MAG: hypothetical protein EZS28_039536, partial [Streblomastix strix]